MKKRPKLELGKILDILYEIKDDVFYFKEYGKDLISSYIKQEQDKNKYSEEEVISLLIKREYALDLYDMANDYEDTVKWFEQFKKEIK